ncbi:DUF4440 domain-containing protein [Pedobacter sp. KBW06]|uniref:nuclear transport factor 2 family protein n=1 Tax=Pedobacter sp. KBW06 TaxID=2153359 RepID=UPI000F5B4856|nr:nuclear transport factor 2 family protein [Pedobacter sp. KBW06]RQO75199.1 DUF4440 domain-containing protein [Pedobacter sp. KBW06]
MKSFKIFIPLFFLLLSFTTGFAQESKPSKTTLFKEIAQADSLMFNAVNNCDTLTYKKFLSPDMEFYHDLGGLTIGADNEVKSIVETCARGNHIRRELVPGSLEVYPIKGYGAIETGAHRFYYTNKGEQEKLSGTFKFVHVWQHKDGQWRLHRVISYGHVKH